MKAASEEESTFVDHILSRSLANMELSDHATDQPQAREGSSSPCFEIPNVPDTFLAQNDNGKSQVHSYLYLQTKIHLMKHIVL